jgi:hypothetical protein
MLTFYDANAIIYSMSEQIVPNKNEQPQPQKLNHIDKIVGSVLLAGTMATVAGGAYAVLEHASNERILNLEAIEKSKKDLLKSGTELTLNNGKIVTLKNTPTTSRQLSLAEENIGFTGDPDVSRPFTKHSSTIHSSSLGFLGPKGISPVPVGVPLSINTESKVDSILIKRQPSDDEIDQMSEMYVASTKPVENVGAELVLDTDGPDSIVLKVYYGDGSPESVDLLLIAGNEN